MHTALVIRTAGGVVISCSLVVLVAKKWYLQWYNTKHVVTIRCEGEEPFIETLDLSCSFSYHLLVLQPRQHQRLPVRTASLH